MLILRWFINAVTLLLVAKLVSGFTIHGLYTALIAALILGFVNATIRRVLIVLTLPINVLSLGLFTLVINALMILFVSTIVRGFDLAGFEPAFWAALLLALISWLTNWFLEARSTY